MHEIASDGKYNKASLHSFGECVSLIKMKKMKKALKKTKANMLFCRQIIKNIEKSSEIKNESLIFGILFRGLENFITLKKKTKPSIWFKNTKLVEDLWIELCDCNDRFNYVSNYLTSDELDWILSQTANLENIFEFHFGKGLYSSIAIRAKNIECSICGDDLRSCNHMNGAIYDGKLCEGFATNLKKGDHVAIVEKPDNLRCRLWPWNIKKKENSPTEISGIMATFFRLDDF